MNNSKDELKGMLNDIINHIKSQLINYKTKSGSMNWGTYHQKRAHQIKLTLRELNPMIHQATRLISKTGIRNENLSLDQKLTVLLMKQLLGKSNRNMAYMLIIFSSMSGIYISYKTIERLYSDRQVYLALLKLHELLFGKKK